MAATLTPDIDIDEVDEVDELPDVDSSPAGDDGGPPPGTPVPNDLGPFLRPALAAGLACCAAALVTGGIFGSWGARFIAVVAVAVGTGWALLALRSPNGSTAYQLSLPPVALAVSVVGVLLIGGDPSSLPQLVNEAIESGRILRPPVPFDPGWVPVLVVVFAMLGFGTAWLGTALGREKLAIAVPLPLLALTAMTQPDDGQFIAGLGAFVPLVAALGTLFGADPSKARELTREFEAKRATRAAAATVGAVVLLVGLGRANVLFPEPVFDPDDRAQKPRPIPLSELEDVVLFEIQTDAAITGPWRTGVLDVYDGSAWRLPPFDKERLVTIPPDGVVDETLVPDADISVTFTTRGLKNSTSLPGLTGAAAIERGDDLTDIQWDPRSGTFRVAEGRIPLDATYTLTMPPYPNAKALSEAPEPVGDFTSQLEIGSPPEFVRDLLRGAPEEPAWARLDFLRTRLRDVVVAEGGGVPGDIGPERVAEILEGPDHEASPYEIVAAEAMLARWAGVPSRIGFGFDGLNKEDDLITVRPRNAAQWLEVYFEGHGWIPLIEPPQEAKNSLDNEDQLFDPDTLAADEVAAAVYIPVRIENLKELYERIRAQLMMLAPWAAGGLVLYLATPAVMKQWRRRKRRRWAAEQGPRSQVAVEYAEFRDAAHDLNLGHPLDTPLEYLDRVIEDDEHAELAWLTSRTLYGDLGDEDVAGPELVEDAERLSDSLRRRMFRGQPFQVRALAVVSKASLRDPYTEEVPTVTLLDPVGRFSAWRSERRRRRQPRRSRRRIPRLVTTLRRRFT